MKQLFDDKGLLNIADIVTTHPSYKTIMEDGIVNDEELTEQSARTLASLRKIQELCNDEQQSAVIDAISEMSVLFSIYHIHELQNLK